MYHWPVARLIRRSLSASSTLAAPRRSTGNTMASPAPVLGGRRSGANSTPLPPAEFATLVGGDGSAQADGWVATTAICCWVLCSRCKALYSNPQTHQHQSPPTLFRHIVVTSMAAGHKHLLLVTADGVVLAAGSNAQGQLGLPGTGGCMSVWVWSVCVYIYLTIPHISCTHTRGRDFGGAERTALLPPPPGPYLDIYVRNTCVDRYTYTPCTHPPI